MVWEVTQQWLISIHLQCRELFAAVAAVVAVATAAAVVAVATAAAVAAVATALLLLFWVALATKIASRMTVASPAASPCLSF